MKGKLILMLVGVAFFLSGCANTFRGMKEDISQLKPNIKKADEAFQEKYW